MSVFKNIFRRKLRAFLTIFGIVIGIFALVMMGSIAEKLTLLVDGGIQYYGDKVTVTDGNGAVASVIASNPISTDKITEIEKIDGVAKASANLMVTLDKEMKSVNIGMPAMVTGSDMRGKNLDNFKITFAKGRDLTPDDQGKAVVGSGLVKKLNAQVGNKITIRDKEYEVIGILEPTLTAPDSTVSISLPEIQEIYKGSLPPALQQNVDADKLASSITVYTKSGVDADKLAEKINKEIKGVKASGPSGFKQDIAEPLKPFNAIIFGVALISLVVGGMSIINTMIMSISERTREIGIRKAIGASESKIMKQFIAESALIGLLGGIVGLLLGWIVTSMINKVLAESNMAIFLLTNRLAFGSLAFSFLLGILSGLYPAWHASRLDPIKALHYE